MRRHLLGLLAGAAVLSYVPYGHARLLDATEMQACFARAEEVYGVPAWLLWGVAKVESGFNPRALNTKNANGTWDIGLMQINSRWLPVLSRYGIRAEDLWDICTNIMVGAWVMAQNIHRMGWRWEAIGAYNARSKDKRVKYAWKIYRAVSGGPSGVISSAGWVQQ